MTKAEFKKAFDELHARYPGFQMPEPKMVMAIWYEDLKRFSLKTFQRSMAEILRQEPQYFPGCGTVKRVLEAEEHGAYMAGCYPEPRFAPFDHGCKLKPQTAKGPRKLLYILCPYEALHILCRLKGEEFQVRCPWCGVEQKSWSNPFVELLMKMHPVETKGWNPTYKGLMLCETCARIPWPRGFVEKSETANTRLL